MSRRTPEISLCSLQIDLPATQNEEAEQIEIQQKIARELQRLPRREREAIEARANLSGETCRAMARRYHKCPQTVSNWATAAAAKLRPRLEGCL